MSTRAPKDQPDTRPGDVVGREVPSGEWRVDRKIPLPWLVGIVGAGCLNAAAMYYSQQQLIASVAELKIEVRALTTLAQNAQLMDREHSLQIIDHERRITALERK